MKQTFDLNNMGFTEMQSEELQVIDGGITSHQWWAIGALVCGAAAIVFTGGMALAAGGAAVCCTGLAL